MKLRTMLSALGLLTAVHGTAGCYVEWGRDTDRRLVPPTPSPIVPDDDEPATFTFSLSRGCAAVLNTSACGPDRPLMVGVREAIRFSIPGNAFGPTPTVTASDPEVLSVSAVTRSSSAGENFRGTVEVRGLRVGASELVIEGADGRAWRYALRVDEPAGMILEGDEGNPRFDPVEGRLQLRVGQQVSLTAYPVNLNVERLYANDGVTWTAPDTRTVNSSGSSCRARAWSTTMCTSRAARRAP
ncbi:MAG: hypothetical protein U0325_08190 [Polyangiales bacterium]